MPRRFFVFLFFCFLTLILVDQLTKYAVFHSEIGDFLNTFRPLAGKQLFINFNFAFSLQLPVVLMYLIYASVLALIASFLRRHYNRLSDIELTAWVLIVAGACSNVFERIALGYVRDFIFFAHGIFNLADGYILVGLVILLFSSFSQGAADKTV